LQRSVAASPKRVCRRRSTKHSKSPPRRQLTFGIETNWAKTHIEKWVEVLEQNGNGSYAWDLVSMFMDPTPNRDVVGSELLRKYMVIDGQITRFGCRMALAVLGWFKDDLENLTRLYNILGGDPAADIVTEMDRSVHAACRGFGINTTQPAM
jgi:hypothetical protein